ncbi:flagellar filament capping protein FliD [Gracilibacillus lacisalsi]|uniref:flagellar filament capping protein FliD n=1 Tax=Gracilibacillus lacisalsi TaxID=393087 RepID=UPI000367994F|nr:flagellar filament capping protein FliD [Gracilibacillus lacisalsi]
MNNMRVTGFASGMDIDSMVRDLMKAERMPLQRMEQQKQELEWKRDSYREMNTLLLDFSSKLTQMKLTTNYRARQVSSTNEDAVTATASSAASQTSFSLTKVDQLAKSASWVNEGAISADSTNKIDASKSLINESSKLDSPVNWEQGVIKNKTEDIDAATTNVSLGETLKTDSALSVEVNGKGFKQSTDQANLAENEFYVDYATGDITFADGVLKKGDTVATQYVTDTNTVSKTISEDVKAIKIGATSIATEDADGNNFADNFNFNYDNTNYKIDLSSQNGDVYTLVDENDPSVSIGQINVATGTIALDSATTAEKDITLDYQQNYTSFGVGANTKDGESYKQFFVTGDQSLNQVVNKVNNADIGVSMMYDSFSDQLTLRRSETGDFVAGEDDITVSGDFIKSTLGFTDAKTNYTEGQNAKFTINDLNTERHSNTFQIDGVTFNLKQTFDGSATGTDQPVTVNVSNDSEAVYENIVEFVESYNELIETLNGKVTEQYHRDYDPLTDEQKESLSETQQEEWTELAKSGLLKNDAILRDTLTKMRRDFYSPVDNGGSSVINQLSEIGIKTTANYMQGGKLEINEAKLKEAIESDPQAVENLFRGDGSEYSDKGIIRRLDETIDGARDRITERAGRATSTNYQFTLGRNLNQIEEQITRFENRLTQVEERYWSQFTAMEQAMQRANQQAAYMQQQFGGMMMQ